MARLRVAIVAPPWLALPVKGYGGIERVIEDLVRELQNAGVHVKLFANGARQLDGVNTSAYYDRELFDKNDFPYYEAPLQILQTHLQYSFNEIMKGQFDIIHDHNAYIGPVFFSLASHFPSSPPILHTFHGPPFSNATTLRSSQEDNRPQFEHMHYLDRWFGVCLSHSMNQSAPAAIEHRLLDPVHNGVDLRALPYCAEKTNYFITLARFNTYKGHHIAVDAVQKHGMNLRMAGTIGGINSWRELSEALTHQSAMEPQNYELEYYRKEILPRTKDDPRIKYVGNLVGMEKARFIGQARALLFPIQWDEPFGMAVIESLACGTPVIALNRGAMPELIEHGVTGFLADSEAEFGQYICRAHEIDPRDCRRAAEEKFSASYMAKQYIQRYRTVVEQTS